MTLPEFSNQFDVYYNNITSNQAPGLNEYEKSVFLTRGEKEVLKNYFNPQGNKYQEGFDGSQKRQADFSTLIRNAVLDKTDGVSFDSRGITYSYPVDAFIIINEQLQDSKQIYTIKPISFDEYDRLMQKPYKYPIKNQVWRLTTSAIEKAVHATEKTSSYKIGTSEYNLRIVSNYAKPFRFAVAITTGASSISISTVDGIDVIACMMNNNSSSVDYWRGFLYENQDILKYVGDFSGDSGASSFPAIPVDEMRTLEDDTIIYDITIRPVSVTVPQVEIIGRFSGSPVYKMRYIKTPKPIILTDLNDIGDDLTIDGYKDITECELPEHMHEEILQRAVELAKIAWTSTGQDNAQSVIQAGLRSE